MLHDHKLIGSERHREWVGAPNIRTRENFKRAYETFPDKTFIARTPIVPGVNMTEEHVRGVLDFIKPYKNVVDYELLPACSQLCRLSSPLRPFAQAPSRNYPVSLDAGAPIPASCEPDLGTARDARS